MDELQVTRRQWRVHPLIVAALVFVPVMAIFLISAWFIYNDNRNRIVASVQSEADKVASLLSEDLVDRFNILQGFATRLAIRPNVSFQSFQFDAQPILQHQEGFSGFAWIDQDLNWRWSLNKNGDTYRPGKPQTISQKERSQIDKAIDARTLSLSAPIELANGGKGFRIYTPVLADGKLIGVLVGVFRFQPWLGFALSKEKLPSLHAKRSHFTFRLTMAGQSMLRKVASYSDASYTPARSELKIGLQQFNAEIRPTDAYLEDQESELVYLVVAIGLAFSALLGGVAGLLVVARNTGAQATFNEAQLRLITDALPVLIAHLDKYQTFRSANRAHEEWFGVAQSEIPGRHIREILGPRAYESVVPMVKTVLTGERISFPATMRTHAGDTRHVNATYIPHFGTGGDVEGFFVLVEDQTEVKNNEAALIKAKAVAEQATKVKSDFLASMSHEIRTPLTGIIGIADLLLDSGLTAQQLEWLTSVKMSGQRLLAILNEILEQSRLESGKLRISNKDFHLASLVDDAVKLFRPLAEEKGLSLTVHTDESLPKGIHSDRMRLNQILSNLLSNAVKFTEPSADPNDPGGIHINLTSEENDEAGLITLAITIADTGVGMNDEQMARIFEPFTQASNTTSATYGGTGLGLSISKQLVELMGGDINVVSEVGNGAVFEIKIPCRPVYRDVEETDGSVNQSKWKADRSLRILVAEDNVINQQVINVMLSELGHQIVLASDGADALKRLSSSSYDILLMDIHMPGMDGIEATDKIRQVEKGDSHLPIIALTAETKDEFVAKYKDAGVDDVCAKPIELAHLLATIDRQLDQPIHKAANVTTHEQSASYKGPLQATDGRAGDLNSDLPDIVEASSLEDILSAARTCLRMSAGERPSAIVEIDGVDADVAAQLIGHFKDQLTVQSGELKRLKVALGSAEIQTDICQAIKAIAHDIKGQAKMFGYDLLAEMAADANTMLLKPKDFDEKDLEQLRFLIEILILTIDEDIAGQGGEVGDVLRQGLLRIA